MLLIGISLLQAKPLFGTQNFSEYCSNLERLILQQYYEIALNWNNIEEYFEPQLRALPIL